MQKETAKFWKCGRKQPYRWEAKARSVAFDLSKQSPREIRAYRCPYCGFWHVGKPRL